MSDKDIERSRYDDEAQNALNTDNLLSVNALTLPLKTPYDFYRSVVVERINSESRVLEIAAGMGENTEFLLATGATVCAIDISEHSLSVMKKRFNTNKLTTKVADMEKLPFADESFDIVVNAGSLSYADHEVVLGEIHRVLKVKGVFIAVDSLNNNPIYRLNRYIHYLRGSRSLSVIKRTPDLKLLHKYEQKFGKIKVKFFGSISFLTPLMIRLFSEKITTKISDGVDRIFSIKKSAFKFVLVAKKTMKNIPFFNYPDLFAQHSKELTDIFQSVSSRGAFIMQNDLIQFEDKLAKYTGIKYALGVANATDAMQLLLKAGGIGVGDEVIFCSHTMVATASAIKFTGAIPVPIEAGADHLMDTTLIEAAITPKTKAIMPTQLNGRVANMDAILAIADKYSLQVYEDSAQALGAKYKGKSAGSFGVGGCISFYPAKVLGCFGDGGAVLTNDKDIYNKIKLMRDHGRGEDGNVSVWGYNSRLDNLQAAILNYFFDDYEAIIQRRRSIANLYDESLRDLVGIVLPPSIDNNPDCFDIFQNYEIEALKRNELKEYLSNKGIGTLIQWGGQAVHEFRDLGFIQLLPFTENIMRTSLLLPLNMSITDDEVDYVCQCIRGFYND